MEANPIYGISTEDKPPCIEVETAKVRCSPPPPPPPPHTHTKMQVVMWLNLFNATYVIPTAKTIPADGTEHKVWGGTLYCKLISWKFTLSYYL